MVIWPLAVQLSGHRQKRQLYTKLRMALVLLAWKKAELHDLIENPEKTPAYSNIQTTTQCVPEFSIYDGYMTQISR